jgi:hypothetical protein
VVQQNAGAHQKKAGGLNPGFNFTVWLLPTPVHPPPQEMGALEQICNFVFDSGARGKLYHEDRANLSNFFDARRSFVDEFSRALRVTPCDVVELSIATAPRHGHCF